jgi:Bacterial Ig-like domain (group 3)
MIGVRALGGAVCSGVVALNSLVATGCIRNGAITGPVLPSPLRVKSNYVLNEIQNYYDGNCLQAGNLIVTNGRASQGSQPTQNAANCGTERQKRDAIIFDLKTIIDINYNDYAIHFQQTADTTTFVGEVAAAGLTGVGTLVAGGLKDILTTASTLTQSTNVSIQKDFFQKQTEYAILAQMNADRLTTWGQIVDRMKSNDVTTYPLNQALNDLFEYRRVGTATAALTSIEQQAGAQSVTASKQINDTTQKPQSAQPNAAATQDTVLNLTSTPNGGGLYSITAAVTTGAPPLMVTQGPVVFAEGAKSLGSAMLGPMGTATVSATLSSGPHQITATYQGSPPYKTSTASVTISVP